MGSAQVECSEVRREHSLSQKPGQLSREGVTKLLKQLSQEPDALLTKQLSLSERHQDGSSRQALAGLMHNSQDGGAAYTCAPDVQQQTLSRYQKHQEVDTAEGGDKVGIARGTRSVLWRILKESEQQSAGGVLDKHALLLKALYKKLETATAAEDEALALDTLAKALLDEQLDGEEALQLALATDLVALTFWKHENARLLAKAGAVGKVMHVRFKQLDKAVHDQAMSIRTAQAAEIWAVDLLMAYLDKRHVEIRAEIPVDQVVPLAVYLICGHELSHSNVGRVAINALENSRAFGVDELHTLAKASMTSLRTELLQDERFPREVIQYLMGLAVKNSPERDILLSAGQLLYDVVSMLRGSSSECHLSGLSCLVFLVIHDHDGAVTGQLASQLQAVECIVELLSPARPLRVRDAAALLLSNLGWDAELRARLLAARTVAPLIDLLQKRIVQGGDKYAEKMDYVTSILVALSALTLKSYEFEDNSEAGFQILVSGGVTTLVGLLRTGTSDVACMAARLLLSAAQHAAPSSHMHLACNPAFVEPFVCGGAIRVILQVLRSGRDEEVTTLLIMVLGVLSVADRGSFCPHLAKACAVEVLLGLLDAGPWGSEVSILSDEAIRLAVPVICRTARTLEGAVAGRYAGGETILNEQVVPYANLYGEDTRHQAMQAAIYFRKSLVIVSEPDWNAFVGQGTEDGILSVPPDCC